MGNRQTIMDKENINNILPQELLSTILQCVPPKDLIRKCSLVCLLWKQVIHNKGFLVEIAQELYGRSLKTTLFQNVLELQMLVVRRPIDRNLIKNSLALNGLQDWKIIENGGDQFAVQKSPSGRESLETMGYQAGEAQCWATSYGWCIKQQDIDVLKEGLTARFIDECVPRIAVKELVSARFDCAAEYFMTVTLLDKAKKPIGKPQTERFSEDQWLGKQWHEVSMTFENYARGLRYIRFQHGGKDKQFWAGHYGTKFTAASVILQIAN